VFSNPSCFLHLRVVRKCSGRKRASYGQQLIALVADNALGENIVHEIATRGLAFKADRAQGPQLYRRRDDAHLIVIRRRPTLAITAILLPDLLTIVAILAVLLMAACKRAAEKRDYERAEQESDHHRAD